MKLDPFCPDLLERLPHLPRKVVLLRPSRIGDFICATPALRALRTRFPEAEITMITNPPLQALAGRLPSIDRAWPFPGFPGLAEQFFEARAVLRFLQEAQQEHFDLAIQMQGTGVYSNTFVLLLGARATAGFVRPGDSPGLLDAALPYPHGVHEIHCVQALTTFLGAPPVGETLEFPLTQEEQREARFLLAAWPQPWIGLHPSARHDKRRWPLDCFVSLAGQLLDRQGGSVILVGDDEALSSSRFIEEHLAGKCLNLTGKVSLTILGALIARLSVLVTNDSGPAHIAYALHSPVVTLFSSRASIATNGPLEAGPFRLLSPDLPSDDGPCSAAQSGLSGIQAIPVAWGVSAAEDLLSER